MSAMKHRETEHSRDRQQQILYAIATYTKQHGYPPTVRDIAAEVGFKTPSAVRHQLDKLRDRGLVDWVDGAARTIRIVKEGAA